MTLSVAFSGAFFAWPYQAGVAAYLQDRGYLDPRSRIYGTSSGAVVAVMLACGIDVERVGLPAGLAANERAQGDRKHPFFNAANVLPTYFEIFGAILPSDAHVRARNRLVVAVTQLSRLKRRMISEYASKQAVLDTLGASIAIPGVTVTFAHKLAPYGWCVDGGPEVPDDDRAGVDTLRVGVGPRLPGGRVDHITPSRPIGVGQRVLIAPEAQRRELFELGKSDAQAYFRRSQRETA